MGIQRAEVQIRASSSSSSFFSGGPLFLSSQEEDVPDVREDPAGDSVVCWCGCGVLLLLLAVVLRGGRRRRRRKGAGAGPIEKPLPQGEILGPGVRVDLRSRHDELSTALTAHRIRPAQSRGLAAAAAAEDLGQGAGKGGVGDGALVPGRGGGLEGGRERALGGGGVAGTERPVAAQVVVAVRRKRGGDVQVPQEREVVVARVVVVPRVARAVDEDRAG